MRSMVIWGYASENCVDDRGFGGNVLIEYLQRPRIVGPCIEIDLVFDEVFDLLPNFVVRLLLFDQPAARSEKYAAAQKDG